MEEQVKKFNPSDYDGYKNLVNFTEKIFDKGFTDLSDKPFNNFSLYDETNSIFIKIKKL